MLEKLSLNHIQRVWRSRYARRFETAVGAVFPPIRGERWKAGRLGPYDEWTIIYDPREDVSQASMDLVKLTLGAGTRAMSVDLSSLCGRTSNSRTLAELMTWPGHHYQFLPALADEVGAKTVVEVGTFQGASALAFREAGLRPSVVTFDVLPWAEIPGTLLSSHDFSEGLTQQIGDLSDPDVFAQHSDILASADLIFVDGPKDGRFEYEFLPKLLGLRRAHRQLLVLDDVKVNPMLNLWHQFPLPKIDASSFGHWSGTGLSFLEP